MFTSSAAYYDLLYQAVGKDYAAESQKIHTLIQTHKKNAANTLLDVACGTGAHLATLKSYYEVEGLDLDGEGLLQVARERFPTIPFHQGDIVDFHLGKQFAAVLCLFSSIGYAASVPRLNQTLQTLAAHLLSGGVLIVEPWIFPDQWQPGGKVHIHTGTDEKATVVRMAKSHTEGRTAVLNFHYLIGTAAGIRHAQEVHHLMLFTDEEYRQAFGQAGINVHFDPEGINGRGLYFGVKD